MTSSAFPAGSEWRRWDLHVHTPESKLGSSFRGVTWDNYLNELEVKAKNSGISVIGVTDYMSIDGYEKLLKAKRDAANPRLQAVSLLVPNIEFRSQPMTENGKALNIHVLVDPSDPDHVLKIKNALRNLKVDFKGNPYGCIRDELIAYAKAQNKTLTDDDQLYRYGIGQFKPSYESLMKWLNSEGWLSANSLVAITNGDDGISGLPVDGFGGTREELLHKSHFVFSGNPADRAFYLGKKEGVKPEQIVERYGSLKPCLHGSDAHVLDKLFEPDQKRYCWIKADPTFEGLRQTLWEPEARVHIGQTAPQQSDSSKVIKSLSIAKHNGWFASDSIRLNSGLVAIIGEKGAGKTAIADLVAFASGEDVNTTSQASFLNKAKLHLQGTEVKLDWLSGNPTSGTLVDKPHGVSRPLVRYLSQDFVERLCSEDHQGNELQRAIEDIVFSRLDEMAKEGYSSFAELRAARETASQNKRDNYRGQLATSHKEIERLQNSVLQLPAKEKLLGQTKQEVEDLKKQLPDVEVLADQSVLELLKGKQLELQSVEGAITERSKIRRSLDDLRKSYAALKEKTAQQIEGLTTALPAEVLSGEIRDRLKPQWDPTVDDALAKLVNDLDAEIKLLQGSEDSVAEDGKTQTAVAARIKTLQQSLSKDESNRKRLLDLQKSIVARETTVSRLTKEIEEIKGKTTTQLKAKEEERQRVYVEFFGALADDMEGLRSLYAPVKDKFAELHTEMKFDLSAGYRVDINSWTEKANRFFDGRKTAATSKKKELDSYVAKTLVPAWQSEDSETVKTAMEEFYRLVSPVNFMTECASPTLSLVELYDWIFSIDHIDTTYKIEYGGTPLEFLSPGTRGIALLVLYLLLDEDDGRPLVIDQPEGNLDNASIYQQLVPYIREAKAKRQIILVTHNPNLVVATDAEQVIVASAKRYGGQSYPRISYTSGSLEHVDSNGSEGIRQAVCTLLEGGEKAFKEREDRYRLGTH